MVRKKLPLSVFSVFLVAASVSLSIEVSDEALEKPSLSRDTAAIDKRSIREKEEAVLLKNWGLQNRLRNSHIFAPEAWRITKGSRDIVVAVIDTGIDPQHPDLKANLWKNPVVNLRAPSDSKNIKAASSAASSLEYGWDFVKNESNPSDTHGHGTHVAGIIGAVTNPKSGVSGVAPQVSIMPVRYYAESNSGSTNLKNTVAAIRYAIDKGARIINYSGGGPEFSQDEYLAIKEAESKGILFVAAAGNEKQNIDVENNFYFPSAYGLKNIISVAAIDIQGNLIRSSNWGVKKVDVAAPGENIYSTLPGGKYGVMTGTSQATAFVTGLAALLLSQDPKLSPEDLKSLIAASVDKIPSLQGKVSSGGKINALQALLALQNRKLNPTAPAAAGPKVAFLPSFFLPEFMTVR